MLLHRGHSYCLAAMEKMRFFSTAMKQRLAWEGLDTGLCPLPRDEYSGMNYTCVVLCRKATKTNALSLCLYDTINSLPAC